MTPEWERKEFHVAANTKATFSVGGKMVMVQAGEGGAMFYWVEQKLPAWTCCGNRDDRCKDACQAPDGCAPMSGECALAEEWAR